MDNDFYKSLNSARLYEQVVEQIETLIMEGQLKSGDRLPAERNLSERFGVSRTVIREAVKALQEKGLVEIRPGVGTFVHNSMSEIMRQSLGRMVMIDRKNGLENLMQVREILEPAIAAIAAIKATPDDLQAMQNAVDIMNCSLNNAESFIAADHEFHLALAHATQNQLIVNLIHSIVDSLVEQRRQIFFATGEGPIHGQEHHIRILKAIRNRDSELARQLMNAHLQQIKEDSGFGTEDDFGKVDSI